MDRIVFGFLVLCLCTLTGARVVAQSPQAAATAVPKTATISGNVIGVAELGDTAVQARDLLTGQVGGSSQPLATGAYTLSGLNPGSYVIELVDATRRIIGTSGFIIAPPGTLVSSATVMATAGVLNAVTTSATGVVATLTSTAARSVTFAAAAAGVAGVMAAPEVPVASPSR